MNNIDVSFFDEGDNVKGLSKSIVSAIMGPYQQAFLGKGSLGLHRDFPFCGVVTDDENAEGMSDTYSGAFGG